MIHRVCKYIVMIIAIICITGCATKRDKFVDYIVEEYNFDCGDSTNSCYYYDNQERNGNDVTEYIYLTHGFEFFNNTFFIGYSNTIFSPDDLLYEYSYNASYNYEDGFMTAWESTSIHKYIYYYKTKKLVERVGVALNNETTYDCTTTQDPTILEECETLKKKCEIAKGAFFKYLGNYKIEDILMK